MGDYTPTDNQDPADEDEMADLLPAYALGVLVDRDRQRVEAWLAGDSSATAELAAFQSVVDRLPLLADELEPPPGLRQRLLAEAALDVTPPIAPTPLPVYRPPAWHARAAPWVLAASILLAVSLGLGVWNALLRGQLDEQVRLAQATASQLAEARAEVASLQAQPRVTIYTVSGTPDAPNATGEVVYVPQQQAAFLTVANLPATPSDRAYQVWFIEQGRPVSAGMLPTAQQNALQQGAARLNADLSRYQAIAISLEPTGGSPQPTGPVVVTAPLTRGNA